MVLDRSWGVILLAVYLVLVGLASLGVAMPARVAGIVALIAGALLLLPLVR